MWPFKKKKPGGSSALGLSTFSQENPALDYNWIRGICKDMVDSQYKDTIKHDPCTPTYTANIASALAHNNRTFTWTDSSKKDNVCTVDKLVELEKYARENRKTLQDIMADAYAKQAERLFCGLGKISPAMTGLDKPTNYTSTNRCPPNVAGPVTARPTSVVAKLRAEVQGWCSGALVLS